jgi:hypothetical protein
MMACWHHRKEFRNQAERFQKSFRRISERSKDFFPRVQYRAAHGQRADLKTGLSGETQQMRLPF